MKVDKFGQIILTEQDICDIYMRDGIDVSISALVDVDVNFDATLELKNIPKLLKYVEKDMSISEFDSELQDKWNMPDEYHKLDIAEWLLDQCVTDEQRQRVGHELLLYLDRNLFKLLQYLKYLVDVMRKNNIVWGVGRGSSVSSYVLFLLGVHKIDSLYYSLDIEEFLR